MHRYSNWDMFSLGFGWNGERNLLNNIVDQAANDLGSVETHVAAMAREVVELRRMVTVLVTMLRDTGVVDGHVLELRLAAAIENAQSAPKLFECSQCGQVVPPAQTTLTPVGPICDACSAKPVGG